MSYNLPAIFFIKINHEKLRLRDVVQFLYGAYSGLNIKSKEIIIELESMILILFDKAGNDYDLKRKDRMKTIKTKTFTCEKNFKG